MKTFFIMLWGIIWMVIRFAVQRGLLIVIGSIGCLVIGLSVAIRLICRACRFYFTEYRGDY